MDIHNQSSTQCKEEFNYYHIIAVELLSWLLYISIVRMCRCGSRTCCEGDEFGPISEARGLAAQPKEAIEDQCAKLTTKFISQIKSKQVKRN